MTTLEEVELQFHKEHNPNHPGYSYPMEFRPLKITDARILAPVLKANAASIRTYLSAYQHADRWYLKDSQKFVSSCVNDDYPRFHYLFLIGKEPVGLASLYEYGDGINEVQVVLAVFGHHQGRGIGKTMAVTLKHLAFDVWGFNRLWWLVDATNRPSIALANHIGCEFDRSWVSEAKHAENESGLWFAMTVDRDPSLPPGILQGAPIQYWNTPKSRGLLKAVVDSGGGTTPIDRTGWSFEEIKKQDLEHGLDF
jgi:RimJ/RimL family protein N-acetyltransferase